MKEIITVTLNPAYDVVISCESISGSKINKKIAEDVDAGGKGVNVSRALKKLGVPSKALILCGSKNSDEFSALLAKDRISAEYIFTGGYIRRNYTIISKRQLLRIDESGDVCDDFAFAQMISERLDKIISDYKNTILVFSGSLPRGIEKSDIISLIKDVKKRGAFIVFDSSSYSKNEILDICPDLIKPNHHELRTMCGKSLVSSEEYMSEIETYVKKGIGRVLLSMENRGILYADSDTRLKVIVPKVSALTTTGAGDCSLAGFLYGMAEGLSLEDSAVYAAATGTASVLTFGTKPPEAKKVRKILSEVTIKQL